MRRVVVSLLALTAVPLVPLAAQQQPASGGGSSVMAATRPHYERTKGWIVKAAEQVPESLYTFRPTPEVRSFGELVGHVANSHYFFCARALGEQPKQTDYEKTATTKAALVEALQGSFAYCDRAYQLSDAQATTGTPAANGRTRVPLDALVFNVAHDSEHYGNMVTYMRMKGLVPPSSQQGM